MCYILGIDCVVLKLGYFGRGIRNTLEVLKCVDGERWRSGRSDHVEKGIILHKVTHNKKKES